MTTETPNVLLIGEGGWRSRIRSQCPNTVFQEADVIPHNLPSSVSLIVVENRNYLSTSADNAWLETAHPRILLCEGPRFMAVNERIVTLPGVDELNDSTLRTYIEDRCPGGQTDPTFEKQVREEDIREFHIALLDAACQILTNWKVSAQARTNKPGEFDEFAFNEHIGQLRSALSHQASVFLTEPSPVELEARANIRVCLYQCEKTVFLAENRVPPNTSFRSATEEDEFSLEGQEDVGFDDLYLTALLIVVLSMAPYKSEFPRCSCRIDENTIQFDFPFPLCDPPCLENGFVARLKNGISTVLSPFGASMEITESACNLKLVRRAR